MAKQAKEKENLDFFYLGEKKVEPVSYTHLQHLLFQRL